MKKREGDVLARAWGRAEWQWLLVALGVLVIAGLLYALFDTASEHMVHARETSRSAPHAGDGLGEGSP